MKIAVGSDERTPLTEAVVNNLRKRGHKLTLFGPLQYAEQYWPAVARQVAEAVAADHAAHL